MMKKVSDTFEVSNTCHQCKRKGLKSLHMKPTTTSEKNLLQGIDTVILRVSAIAQSKEWYTTKLGLATAWEAPEMQLVVLDTGSPVSLTLWQTSETIKVNPQASSFPIFRTTDAAALRQLLLEKGVKTGELITDPHVTYFQFYDPDGNILEACQVLPEQSS